MANGIGLSEMSEMSEISAGFLRHASHLVSAEPTTEEEAAVFGNRPSLQYIEKLDLIPLKVSDLRVRFYTSSLCRCMWEYK